MLTLASMIDDVVRLYPKYEWHFEDPPAPPPPGEAPSLSVDQMEAMNSLKWLERQAGKLRDLAEIRQSDISDWSDDYVRVHASRQNRGAKKGNRSRVLGVFMQKMVNDMYKCCGKPSHHAVAAMTNIAFPGATVDPEDVRSVCKPTTRAGRRRKTGALNQ